MEPKALKKALAVIRNFKQDWSGRAVDDDGLIHIANEAGTRRPLIWCFNASHEFERLAAALGSEQPLIGLRSGHMVARGGYRSTRLDFKIADIYYERIREHFPDARFFIGGNCQGANTAARLKECFAVDGIPVLGAFHMESMTLQPFAGDQVMVYGEQSAKFNPCLSDDALLNTWGSIFRSVEARALPGEHGRYFEPDTIGALAEIISEHIADKMDPAASPDPSDIVAELSGHVMSQPIAGSIFVSVRLSSRQHTGRTTPQGLKLYAFWHCLERLDARNELIDVSGRLYETSILLNLQAPDPGIWNLTLYPVLEGAGPVNIAAARQRGVDMVVPRLS